MRKPNTVKELYKRFSELCIEATNLNSEYKYLIKKRYWFAVPVKVRGIFGYDWTIADLTINGSITLQNECVDGRKNWKYTYEKGIYRTRKTRRIV